MGTGDHNAGGYFPLTCDDLASHPVGSSNAPSRIMLQKLELSTSLMGLLPHMQTLPYFILSALHVETCELF